MRRLIITVCLVLFVIPLFIIALKGGDFFLDYLGTRLYINIDHRNRAGFFSCFILKHINLESPTISLGDRNIILFAKNGFIRPFFKDFKKDTSITLSCYLNDISPIRSKSIELSKMPYILWNELKYLPPLIEDISFDYLLVTVRLYNDRVEFISCEAGDRYVKIYAEGIVTQKGSFDLKIRFYFAPEIANKLPGFIRELSEKLKDDWVRYSIDVKLRRDTPEFTLKSERLKIDFFRQKKAE